MYFVYGNAGRPISGIDALGSAAMDWFLWGLLSPFLFWAARRFPLVSGERIRSAAIHFALGLVIPAVQIAVYAGASAWIREARFASGSFPDELRSGLLLRLQTCIAVYWAAILGIAFWDSEQRRRATQLHRARLDQELSEARLRALQSQLRPHFLFNALNTILDAVRRAPDEAERMIVSLGDLLRQTLRHDERRELSVTEELALLSRYVAIEEARFGGRLSVQIRATPETHCLLLPCFLLQPLVENAIRHGVKKRNGGQVSVDVTRDTDQLCVRVRDNGPGVSKNPDLNRKQPPDPRLSKDAHLDPAGGTGLANTRQRLSLLYPSSHQLEILAREPTGTEIRIRLPARSITANDRWVHE